MGAFTRCNMKKFLLLFVLLIPTTTYADSEYQEVLSKLCGAYANLAVTIANYSFEGFPLHKALTHVNPENYQLVLAIYDYPRPSNKQEMFKTIEEIHTATYLGCLRGFESN